jgi:hypothetical protein
MPELSAEDGALPPKVHGYTLLIWVLLSASARRIFDYSQSPALRTQHCL